MGVLASLVAALPAQKPGCELVAPRRRVGQTLGADGRARVLVQIVEGVAGALPLAIAGTAQQVCSPRPRPSPHLALRRTQSRRGHKPPAVEPNRPSVAEPAAVREYSTLVVSALPGSRP